MIFWHVIRPFIKLLINTTDHECGSVEQGLITFFSIWYDLAYPLTAQLIFIGLIM